MLLTMSNLVPKRTGVQGAVIWVSAGEVDPQHGLCIKVVLGARITTDALDDAVSVRLSDPPEVLGNLLGQVKRDVIRFIDLNRTTLLAYSSLCIDTATMIERLVKVTTDA